MSTVRPGGQASFSPHWNAAKHLLEPIAMHSDILAPRLERLHLDLPAQAAAALLSKLVVSGALQGIGGYCPGFRPAGSQSNGPCRRRHCRLLWRRRSQPLPSTPLLQVGLVCGDLEVAQTALTELQAPGIALLADVNRCAAACRWLQCAGKPTRVEPLMQAPAARVGRMPPAGSTMTCPSTLTACSCQLPSACHSSSLVETPFGGAAYHPLFAAAATPLPHSLALAAAQRLMELGAAVNVRCRDCGGEHTPLSKALVLRNWPLAELLLQQGAGGLVGGGGWGLPAGSDHTVRHRQLALHLLGNLSAHAAAVQCT